MKGVKYNAIFKKPNGDKLDLNNLSMKELSNKYGKQKPFDDDQLFNEIESMTFPSIGKFIKDEIQRQLEDELLN